MDWDFGEEDLFTKFVLFLEGRMDRILGITPFDMDLSPPLLMTPEVGETSSVSKALLFKEGTVSMISGTSSDLANNGYKPYDASHFNTQFGIAITKAMATFHALLRASGKRQLCSPSGTEETNNRCQTEKHKMEDSLNEAELFMLNYNDIQKNNQQRFDDKDSWTNNVSRSSLVSANLSILCSQFEQENVSPRIIQKLQSLDNDVGTFTQFLQFSTAMQKESCLQSIGPVCMCDIWVPETSAEGREDEEDVEEEEDKTIVIRLRGGTNLQAPPMRDVTWLWLTLLRPQILQNRYIELCESYCSAFNDTIRRLDTTDVQELTLFEIMRDLGDSFLHGFLTIVHKFTVSGVWSLDRQLYTSEGIHSIADSITFLIDNGIIGSLFIV